MCRTSLPEVACAGSRPTGEAILVDLTDCLSPRSRWEQGFPMDGNDPESFLHRESQPSFNMFQAMDTLQSSHMAQVPYACTSGALPFTYNARECAGLETVLERSTSGCYPTRHDMNTLGAGLMHVSMQASRQTENGEISCWAYKEHHPSASTARRRRRLRAAGSHAHQQWNGVRGNGCAWRKKDDVCPASFKGSVQPIQSNDHVVAQPVFRSADTHASLTDVRGSMRRLTFDPVGCRVAQQALQEADHKDAAGLCAELQGCVRRAIPSPFGNYVIQKVIEVLPVSHSRFIVAELIGSGAEVSRHRYGCRIMCRLVEHSSKDPLTIQLIEETLQGAGELCRHEFAHHVIESILEHGLDEQKHWIALRLQAGIFDFACDMHCSYVIESALRNCSSADQDGLVGAFLADEEGLKFLANHRSGVHVVRTLKKHAAREPSICALLHQNLQEELYPLASVETHPLKSNL